MNKEQPHNFEYYECLETCITECKHYCGYSRESDGFKNA